MQIDPSIKNKRIIVAPLCWGLGHAARCVPIIRQLLLQQNIVMLASDGVALDLLKLEFPELQSFTLPAYDITYNYKSMAVNMMVQTSKIRSAIIQEGKAADRLVKEHNVDLVISDNRLGFRSKYAKNIYITHQVNVLSTNSLSSYIATKIHAYFYNKFEVLWIPDHEDIQSLAGKLSEPPTKIKYRFIGCISRLQKLESVNKYDILIILSGPEPQRTELEGKLVNSFSRTDQNICLVRGTNQSHDIVKNGITIFDFVDGDTLSGLIAESNQVVCRSGYTSIMDLVSLGRGATLIPTPGQTEQEYLAEYLDGKYGFQKLEQENVDEELFLVKKITLKLNYREGGVQDKEQLKKLALIAYGQFEKVLTTENWNKLYGKLQSESSYSNLLEIAKCFICEVGNEVVGVAYLVPSGNPTEIYESGWCHIRMVGVNPAYRSKGIGKVLTQKCIKYAQENNEQIIALHTSEFMDPARYIYENIGFKKDKELKPIFGKKYWLYKMKLN